MPLHFAMIFDRTFLRETRYGSHNAINIQSRVVSNVSRQNFTYRAAVLWNSLPGELRMMDTFSVFKQKTKDWVRANVK